MSALVGIIIGFIILAFLVIVHEFGHALAAKRSGVVIEEFGIGMPPKAWSKKLKNGVTLSINWLLFGGFVKLQGEFDESKNKGDYGSASFWQKTKILFAGVTMNCLVAVIILTVLSAIGMPKIISNQFSIAADSNTVVRPVEVVSVEDNSSASKAGIKQSDIIKKFNSISITTDEQLVDLINQNKGREVNVVYQSGEKIKSVKVKLGTNYAKGYLGVGLSQREYIRSTWSSPIVGVVTTGQFAWETLKGIGQLISDLVVNLYRQFDSDIVVRQVAKGMLKKVGDTVTGPVGIVGVIFPTASQSGPAQIALLAAIISISLAVMNILPIPALDGGRWFTMTLFRIFRKKLTISREEKIQSFGFLVMMGLVILVTILDVKRFF